MSKYGSMRRPASKISKKKQIAYVQKSFVRGVLVLFLATLISFLGLGGPILEVVLASSKISKSNPSHPIEIDADQGIEWLAEDKVYLARGNANAKQGDFSMRADILKAF